MSAESAPISASTPTSGPASGPASGPVPNLDASPAVVLRGGRVFDGTGGPSIVADVLVRDGVVAAIGRDLAVPEGTVSIDAGGRWVTPGFIDMHTHYDAEVELSPKLGESVRHGVTTVLFGSCGLSFVMGTPEDLADQFCRVEGVPRDLVLPLLEKIKDWEGPESYAEHLRGAPLGPNATLFFGHSAVRAAVMGLGRSVDPGVRPTDGEQRRMERHLHEALDVGYLGMSFNTLPWDKLGGERYNSSPTPSVFASFGEYRRFARILRERDRIFQVVPDLQGRWNVPLLMSMSTGIGRRTLKVNLLSMLDPIAARNAHRMVGEGAAFFNRFLRSDVRFQAMPIVFDLFVDGLEVPVIEEFEAGTEALSITSQEDRKRLMTDPRYRERFKRQWRRRLAPKAWHRKLDEPRILDCPDRSLVGRTFAEIAAERGDADPLDTFLDLQAAYGNELRWRTVVANERPASIHYIAKSPSAIIGFADSGAHLRNMAFYDLPLHMLRLATDADGTAPVVTPEFAVRRVTGEIADYLGIDAGYLRVGERADLAVVDPTTLDARLDNIVEDDTEALLGIRRLVRRHDECVPLVMVNGRIAWRDGEFVPGFGEARGFGDLLLSKAA